MTDQAQYDRGVARLKELFGDDYAATPKGDEFMDITTGYLFGDIWTRPGLELQQRSLITCSVLVALGKEPQLKVHLRGLLHTGMPQESVEEMMMHIAHYAGWPTAVNGIRVAREVFKEMDAQDQ